MMSGILRETGLYNRKQRTSSLALISPYPDNVYLVHIHNFCYKSTNNHVYVSDTKDVALLKRDYLCILIILLRIVRNNNIIQDEVIMIELVQEMRKYCLLFQKIQIKK